MHLRDQTAGHIVIVEPPETGLPIAITGPSPEPIREPIARIIHDNVLKVMNPAAIHPQTVNDRHRVVIPGAEAVQVITNEVKTIPIDQMVVINKSLLAAVRKEVVGQVVTNINLQTVAHQAVEGPTVRYKLKAAPEIPVATAKATAPEAIPTAEARVPEAKVHPVLDQEEEIKVG